MRKTPSKEEVISLINNIPNNETVWIDDEKDRNKKFKQIAEYILSRIS